MSDFDSQVFPFVFECRCGSEQEVTRRECMDYAPDMGGRAFRAAELVVQSLHGWFPVDRANLRCPDCADPEESEGEFNQLNLFAGTE